MHPARQVSPYQKDVSGLQSSTGATETVDTADSTTAFLTVSGEIVSMIAGAVLAVSITGGSSTLSILKSKPLILGDANSLIADLVGYCTSNCKWIAR